MENQAKEYQVIGLMSGTSLDGIDAALIRTDGERVTAREGFVYLPYPDNLRGDIRAVFGRRHEDAPEAERAVTLAHAEAVRMLLEKTGTVAHDVDLIGFHGQTIMHAPAQGYTCQLGDGALLAKMTGIKVVNDFRSADVRAGGQGAPLVPVYHRALAAELEKPVVFLNIGGVASLTYVGENGELIAFDAGPGNALLDDWMLQKAGKKFDGGGLAAKAGTPDEAALATLTALPYFVAHPPKSLDRDAFAPYLTATGHRTWGLEDGAATLAAFTAWAIAKSQEFFPAPPKKWIVCGGGRHNAFFMEMLAKTLPAPVAPIESLGLDGDATEAEAFGYLAVRTLRGLPLSFPDTTGVRAPLTGGVVHDVPR